MKFYYTLAGASLGFIAFVASLETHGMSNNIYRNGKFRPGHIVSFIKSPFESEVFWHKDLLRHNWIVCTTVGTAVGLLLDVAT